MAREKMLSRCKYLPIESLSPPKRRRAEGDIKNKCEHFLLRGDFHAGIGSECFSPPFSIGRRERGKGGEGSISRRIGFDREEEEETYFE